jgi:hypothetical protein
MKMKTTLPIIGILAAALFQSLEVYAAEKPLFDGKTLAGWEGNTNTFRVESGSIVAGSLDRKQPHNEFLATTQEFGNFDLKMQFKLEGTNGFVNAGVQFWSQRIPKDEMIGYQSDIGAGYTGGLYDESRRKKVLQMPSKELQKKAEKIGDWNDYRIRAEGKHIEQWLNGEKTVDYTETDADIPQRGKFGLQIHGGAFSKIQYRNIVIEELP